MGDDTVEVLRALWAAGAEDDDIDAICGPSKDCKNMKGVTFETNVGRRGQAAMAATSTLLFATGQTADNRPALFGIDKKTGKRVGSVEVSRLGGYGLMTYLHQGKQYIVIPINGGYTAMALP